MVKKGESGYPEDRQLVRISPSAHGTAHVVNYAADNNSLNGFLSAFDIWGNNGEFKLSDDGKHSEVWFEMAMEFSEFSKTETMKRAWERFGVRVVFG